MKYVQIKDGQDRDLIQVVRRLLLQGFLPLTDDNSRLFTVIVVSAILFYGSGINTSDSNILKVEVHVKSKRF